MRRPVTHIDEALRASETRFAMLFEQAAVGMCFVGLDGTFHQVNRRFCELVGFTGDELAAMTCVELTHPDDRPGEKETTSRMLAGELDSSSWEKRYVRPDGTPVWCDLTLSLLCDKRGRPYQFVGIVIDISARKRAMQKIEENEALLRIAGETAHLGGWALDFSDASESGGPVMTWSDEVCAIHEVPAGAVPSLNDGIAYYLPESLARINAAVAACRRDGTPYDLELEMTTARGRRRWVRSIGRSEQGGARLVGAYQDITERKEAELELVRMNRSLKMLSGCSDVLVRATEEARLLADVCALVVDVGKYMMAWVGYARDDERKSVDTVTFAGKEAGYFTDAKISWSTDDPAGLGGIGRAIRGGHPVVIADLATDPCFAPWREAALARGYRSAICLPLRDGEKTYGAMVLYGDTAGAPPPAEMLLLQELASDLAFGIAHIRAQREQQRIYEAMLKVSAGVSDPTGNQFFERLVASMSDAVGAQAAFIARYDAKQPDIARTIVGLVDGVPLANFEFSTVGTPCGDLRSDIALVVPSGLAQRYPACGLAAKTGASAFVGWRLEDSSGKPLAMMFVLFREPLGRYDLTISALKIFVVRAAGELERQIADAQIADQAAWLDNARDAIIVRNIDGRVTFWNEGAERLYGWSSGEALDASLAALSIEEPERLSEASTHVAEFGHWTSESVRRRKDGSLVWVESRWTVVHDADGEARSVLSIDTDITDRKASEREIEHLAFYDQLTSLPNRMLFVKRLKAALENETGFGGLLFIDLDNFKTLNDTLGHDKGDLLLEQVANRLARCVRGSDTVARFGGDEFVIMLHDLGNGRERSELTAKKVADTVLAAFAQPFDLEHYVHNCTPSIGITVFTAGEAAEDVLKQADLAMYQAKAAGRNTVRFFDPQMQAVVTERRALEEDIRVALQLGEFFLVYQPQVDVGANVIGAEALVRWQHGKRGLVPPAEFIPVAEDAALIVPLGRWILHAACERLVAWSQRTETAHLKLSVNVSAREFRHPDFVQNVRDTLAETGADPRRLVLELTESVLVDDIDTVIAKMSALREHGVEFSLDDFGTGYSSLAYLKRLPLQQLKIDQSFVRDVLVDSNDAVIARTIIGLAQSLSLDVIAEGVESQAQRRFLASNGCRSFQGYLYSRPLLPDAFVEFVLERAHHAKYGFPRRSSPIVVEGPCPGTTTAESA